MRRSTRPEAAERRQANAYPLRLPPEVKAEVEASAKRTGRSLNAEIAAQLRGAPNVADLRDRFAEKAMLGLLARPFTKDERGRPFVEWVADLSYELADEMLKAREGGAV